MFPHLPHKLPSEWTKYSGSKKKYSHLYGEKAYEQLRVSCGTNILVS